MGFQVAVSRTHQRAEATEYDLIALHLWFESNRAYQIFPLNQEGHKLQREIYGRLPGLEPGFSFPISASTFAFSRPRSAPLIHLAYTVKNILAFLCPIWRAM